MDLFIHKKQNTEAEDEMSILDSDLYLRPKKEKKPAKVYGLLFIILCAAAAVFILISDSEPEEKAATPSALISIAEGRQPEAAEEQQEIDEGLEELPTEAATVIPDYNQQPGQATVEYRRYQIGSIIYEIRNDAAFVVGTVGNTKNVK